MRSSTGTIFLYLFVSIVLKEKCQQFLAIFFFDSFYAVGADEVLSDEFKSSIELLEIRGLFESGV
jgi:hypothetical protein